MQETGTILNTIVIVRTCSLNFLKFAIGYRRNCRYSHAASMARRIQSAAPATPPVGFQPDRQHCPGDANKGGGRAAHPTALCQKRGESRAAAAPSLRPRRRAGWSRSDCPEPSASRRPGPPAETPVSRRRPGPGP